MSVSSSIKHKKNTIIVIIIITIIIIIIIISILEYVNHNCSTPSNDFIS